MKIKSHLLILISVLLFLSCTSKKNDPEFLKQFSGNYLYTDDELVYIHSDNNELLLDWRGAKNIKPLKTDDDTFYVKEMNSKIRFAVNPSDNKEYLVFMPKSKEDTLQYLHYKVGKNYKTPSMHLSDNNYEKALEGFLKIKKKDSVSPLINRRKLNRLGYNYLRGKDSIKKAIEIFKINAALHPDNDNVYDSLGDGYKMDKDTANAILNYEKALAIDSGSRHTKRKLEDLQKNYSKEIEKETTN